MLVCLSPPRTALDSRTVTNKLLCIKYKPSGCALSPTRSAVDSRSSEGFRYRHSSKSRSITSIKSNEKVSNTQNMKTLGGVASVKKTETLYKITYHTGESAKLSILNSHVFRYQMSPTGEFLDYPSPNKPDQTAKITVKKVADYDKNIFDGSFLKEDNIYFIINTDDIEIELNKKDGTIVVYDIRVQKYVAREHTAISYTDSEATQILVQHPDEYFYGGGMQNGRFSHKGQAIHILNTNKWNDNGITSPCPFFWSTYGYGVLRNTWRPGKYDFGIQNPKIVHTQHSDKYFDAFYFINPQPKDILNDYYELTGQPLFMPDFAFYEAHSSSFNRDYWVKVTPETKKAILFEDGEYYKKYQPKDLGNKESILESLNGEKNNYQFSARAMIERYNYNDLPLGWFIPNDGYGCGYGQTDSLAGDIQNLAKFADFARQRGVEVGLWTESKLKPENPDHPKKGDRDLDAEVGLAGIVALKCEASWVGHGYSFAFNAVENAKNIFVENCKNARPLIIMVDGWAGIQRLAGIWSGNQYGGQWNNIRFHIPTFIGSGLSGLPVVGSDMDGIFGGGDKNVYIRDYQWKTFTPLQINMDGWGDMQKSPFSFDKEATDIVRMYLKLKSMLMPYNYTIGYESTHGLPMIRAMFLEFPEEIPAHTRDSQYQFMWGPNILVAPIYNDLKDGNNTSVRDGVYLPDKNQIWIDFFTGAKYQGGKIYNNIKVPLWKIPIFIKDGAIIPMTEPNNNPSQLTKEYRLFRLYPNGNTEFEVYEDDGKSTVYLKGYYAKTKITASGPQSNTRGDLVIHVGKTSGYYDKIITEKETLIEIMASENVESIEADINGEPLIITLAKSDEEFGLNQNIYYFKRDFAVSPLLKDYVEDLPVQKFLLIKIHKVDVTKDEIHLKLKNYVNNDGPIFSNTTNLDQSLRVPRGFSSIEDKTTSSSISLEWQKVDGVSYYEIDRDGIIFSNITGDSFTFDGFTPESEHTFKIRTVNNNGCSKWSNGITKNTDESPDKSTVRGITVKCNTPSQPNQDVANLIDGDERTMWHTDWNRSMVADPKTGNKIELQFDLQDVYEIDRVVYTPRKDGSENGILMQIRYTYSVDGKNKSPAISINWEKDKTNKTISLNGAKLRFMEFEILEAGGGFGSGVHMKFFKKVA